jgi:accessory gene regulator protein AgrB
MVNVQNYSQEADMEAFTVKRTNLWTQKLNRTKAIITLYVLITNNMVEHNYFLTKSLMSLLTIISSSPVIFKGF